MSGGSRISQRGRQSPGVNLLFGNNQWRIQDFPEGDANSQSGCANLFFGRKLHENLDREGPPLSLGSVTDDTDLNEM